MNGATIIRGALVLLGTAIIAYQIYLLVMLYLADIHPSTPVQTGDNLQYGPADVSALIEEAKRITGESS